MIKKPVFLGEPEGFTLSFQLSAAMAIGLDSDVIFQSVLDSGVRCELNLEGEDPGDFKFQDKSTYSLVHHIVSSSVEKGHLKVLNLILKNDIEVLSAIDDVLPHKLKSIGNNGDFILFLLDRWPDKYMWCVDTINLHEWAE